jgi:hypothetical protein
LVVFDRWLPPSAPSRPALFLAPPAADWLGKPGVEEKTPSWVRAAGHDVLAGVDPLTLDIKKARGYETSVLTTVAQSEKGTSLVLVADAPERRYVALSFAIADSNLAFAPAFPVLIGNAIDWLARPSFGPSRRPGRITLPSSTVRVTGPSGAAVPVARAGDQVVATLPSQGCIVEVGGSRGVIAVNVGDGGFQPESIEPGWRACTASAGRRTAVVDVCGDRRVSARTIEWWTWQRRVTVTGSLTVPGALWLLGCAARVAGVTPAARLSSRQQMLQAFCRSLLLATLAFALARPVISMGSSRMSAVYLVDVSHSVSSRAIADAAARIDSLNTDVKPSHWRIVAFGADATVLETTDALRALGALDPPT